MVTFVALEQELGTLAAPGHDGSVLFAGATKGRLGLDEHRSLRIDAHLLRGAALREAIATTNLTGRGGASFPLDRKLEAMEAAGGSSTVIVNLSESEPASAKDRTLAMLRPHALLDGAALLAEIAGASEVIIAMHEESGAVGWSLDEAFRERRARGLDDPRWVRRSGPEGYVRGEAGAVADRVAGGAGLPIHRTGPLARRGPSGGPTLVSNAETVAQVAVLSELGIDRFLRVGTSHCAGTRVLTLAGDVTHPGSVLEVAGSVPFSRLFQRAGYGEPPPFVLLGGYAGSWVPGDALWDAEISDAGLAAFGASVGCGVVGIVGTGRCPLKEVSRLTTYLAAQSAGQCGPCVHGLPELASELERLIRTGRSGGVRRIDRISGELRGRGACSHPDAAVSMVASALEVMGAELERHRRASCSHVGVTREVFPLESPVMVA